ncbi:cation-translocating P-type ATPase [Mycolicibacterium thermoresistibile]
MSIFGAPLRALQLATGAALLAGDAAAGVGRAIAGTAAAVLTETATGAVSTARGTVEKAGEVARVAPRARRVAGAITVEAFGGAPARRSSRRGNRRWIEICGLNSPDADVIADEVLTAVRAVPGVTDAVINRSVARVVVTVGPEGPAENLIDVVIAAENRVRSHPCHPRHRPLTLPGDDALLAARTLGAAAAVVGLGLSVTGNALRLRGLPDLLSVIPTVSANVPRVRHQIEGRLGRDSTDLLFAVLNAASAALTVSPTSAAAETASRTLLAAEAWYARMAWHRHEQLLAVQAPDGGEPDRGTLVFDYGPSERYSDRVAGIGMTAASVLGALSRNPTVAATTALVTAPKPSRAAREAFGFAMTRGLTTHHDVVVMRPRALRHLDRIDAIVIDPRALHTDELAVTRMEGVDAAQRTGAWAAVQDVLDRDGLSPGWHRLSTIRGAGRAGRVLISPVRDPLATAVVTEARRTEPQVVSVADDGLRSLAQGFDRLYPLTGSVDDAVAAAVAALKADGATVTLLTTAAMAAEHDADITIGLSRSGQPPPWGADVFVTDLGSVWRVLHALPAARTATANGIRLSVSTTALGALMLIPGVPGSGPEAVNAGMVAALWSGFRSGNKVFRTPVPDLETTRDWHALPVSEVQRLLPRPTEEPADPPPSNRLLNVPPVRAVQRASAWPWGVARDFAGELRTNLSDPITPLLATGAAASALLGSPLDAALVGGVLLANAALSAQQQLHAERVLRRLSAVQEPLARRRLGPLGDGRHERVPATRLRIGDVIELHANEVVPADARLIETSNVEVDESTLTGESLPVPKHTDPTPGAPLAERAGMIYQGSTLVAGTAVGVVTAVGSRTEMRRALALAPDRSGEIGLQRQLRHLTSRALPFSVSSGALVGVLSVFRGTPVREAVASAVSLIVAAVPEGLPLVVTLAQLAAARRLSGESVLVRNAQSVEALARLQVVCFDKTGTLSENRLRVKAVRPVGRRTEEEVLDAALLTTLARPGHRSQHATDEAIRRAVYGNGAAAKVAAPIERDAFLPFQAGRPFAAAITGDRLTIKGAPEVLAAAMVRGNGARAAAIDALAADGLRVIAVAERQLTGEQVRRASADTAEFERLCRSQLRPIGLLGLADTPRESAHRVLDTLAERDIGVRLITGDHPLTATVVAAELGLQVTEEQVITGTEWEMLSAEERVEAVRSRLVFARMAPEHKIAIVQTLERAGVVTAMVGDGANDAAAIRAASVGVGMAARGSDPARTAADIVLLDGRIEALIDALDEGRQLWRRVQSAVSMLLGGNAGEIAFALITSLVTGRSVLNARQMLLVNMLTDALPAAALAVSQQTHDEAVDLDEAALWRAIGIRGAATTLGATLAWVMARTTGTRSRASTVALIGLVSTQLVQTLTDSRGRLVVLTALGSFAVLAGIVSTPGVSQVFGCTPVGPIGWGQAFLATAVAGAAAVLAPGLLSRVATAAGGLSAQAAGGLSAQAAGGLSAQAAGGLSAQAAGGGSVLVDDNDADLHEDGVDRPQRRGEQADTRIDEGVGAGKARVVSHGDRLCKAPDETGSRR